MVKRVTLGIDEIEHDIRDVEQDVIYSTHDSILSVDLSSTTDGNVFDILG